MQCYGTTGAFFNEDMAKKAMFSLRKAEKTSQEIKKILNLPATFYAWQLLDRLRQVGLVRNLSEPKAYHTVWTLTPEGLKSLKGA